MNKITKGYDYNFYQKANVSWTSFGGGFSDATSPDMLILFPTQSIIMLNESSGSGKVIEYSFNGNTVHGELDPELPTRGMVFDNRIVSKIWFRVKSGSSGPITIRCDAWAGR